MDNTFLPLLQRRGGTKDVRLITALSPLEGKGDFCYNAIVSKRKDRERVRTTGTVMRDGKLVKNNEVDKVKGQKVLNQELARVEFRKALTVIGGRLFGVRPRRQGD